MTRRPTEAECQTTIVDAARLTGWLVHHTRPAQTGSGRWATPLQGHPGFPDLVLLHPFHHRFVVVELKRRPNRIEPAQQRWLNSLTSAGIDTRVWWVPEDLDHACAWLTNPT